MTFGHDHIQVFLPSEGLALFFRISFSPRLPEIENQPVCKYASTDIDRRPIHSEILPEPLFSLRLSEKPTASTPATHPSACRPYRNHCPQHRKLCNLSVRRSWS